MNKAILHSLLETVTASSELSIVFNEPFADLTGDYTVLVSKTGRGRGGSRVLEIQPKGGAPEEAFGALELSDGVEHLLGTGTSEVFQTVLFNGKTYGTEEADTSSVSKAAKPKTPRKAAEKREAKVASDKDQSAKVAEVLGKILLENPNTNFKLVGTSRASEVNGEWKVNMFSYENGTLLMHMTGLDNPEKSFDFDSRLHGSSVKDAQVICVEETNETA